jgi:hypothetical protein
VSTLKHLSPVFVAFLRTLKAVHSGVEQADFSRSGKRGGIVRREPVEHIHPLVRRHPVTGEEALYVNRQFTRRIVGLKREESGTFLIVHAAIYISTRTDIWGQKPSCASCTTTSTAASITRHVSGGVLTRSCYGITESPLMYVYISL